VKPPVVDTSVELAVSAIVVQLSALKFQTSVIEVGALP